MIMPTKHTNIEQSLIGFGGYLLNIIEGGSTVDELWGKYLKDYSDGVYSSKQSIDNLLLTLVFLFSIDAIYEDNGEVKKCV